MSVLIVNPKIFTEVKNKMYSYTFRHEVNIDYCDTCRTLTEKNIIELVNAWSILNELSFCEKYNENFTFEYLKIDKSFYLNNFKTVQIFKWFELIRYNIDICYIKQETLNKLGYDEDTQKFLFASVLILENILNEIKSRIIHDLNEYKSAFWSECDINYISRTKIENRDHYYKINDIYN